MYAKLPIVGTTQCYYMNIVIYCYYYWHEPSSILHVDFCIIGENMIKKIAINI